MILPPGARPQHSVRDADAWLATTPRRRHAQTGVTGARSLWTALRICVQVVCQFRRVRVLGFGAPCAISALTRAAARARTSRGGHPPPAARHAATACRKRVLIIVQH